MFERHGESEDYFGNNYTLIKLTSLISELQISQLLSLRNK
jgi:hypothetical protein